MYRKLRPHFDTQNRVYHNFVHLYSWISSLCNVLESRIHRIMVCKNQITRFHTETCVLCVSFVSYHQGYNSPHVSSTPSIMTVVTVFDLKIDLDHFRSRFRHLSAPTHRSGPFGSLRMRIFVTALPRSSKSWVFVIWIFEFQKTVNGHINGKFLYFGSRLVGPREGLSISTLSVEIYNVKVTYTITHSLLGVELTQGVLSSSEL